LYPEFLAQLQWSPAMETARIAELLQPYLQKAKADGGREELSPKQLHELCDYLELLLRWNAKTNLTAVREPEQIVTRHFGESLFLAQTVSGEAMQTAIDIGSGAGFPGIPLKIYAPNLAVTLTESQNKKATFLNEVIRKLTLMDINVFAGRAEDSGRTADLVTLRAVEKFESAVAIAAKLTKPIGRLALLTGAGQVEAAKKLLSGFEISTTAVPKSRERTLVIARRNQG
jgi:16S rRNA (guanine527-N7)-methyltransferase